MRSHTNGHVNGEECEWHPLIGHERLSNGDGKTLGSPQIKSPKSSTEASRPQHHPTPGNEDDTIIHSQQHRPPQQQKLQPSQPRVQPVSGIPLRSTRSAQQSSSNTSQGHTNHGNGDSPPSSYPRSHLAPVRMRSTSNGQITKVTHSDQNSHLNFSRPVVGGTTAAGGPSAIKGSRTQLRGVGHAYVGKVSGYGNGVVKVNGANTKRIAVGSLV